MSTSSDLMYRFLVDGVTDYAIYMVDRDGIILNWNEGARRANGYSDGEVIGRNYKMFYSLGEQATQLPQRNLEIAFEQGRIALEGWRFRRDGSCYWASVTIDSIYDDGKLLGFAKITHDLTAHHELVSRLEYSATHDPLTGLLNRTGFFNRLEAELAKKRAVTVFAVDLDHFKPINDRYGHAVGDAVLKAVAERLARRVDMDFVGRLGGDEFVAVKCRKADPVTIPLVGLAVTDVIRAPIYLGEQELTVGASVGWASTKDPADTVDVLLARADTALYVAKRQARNA
ncbi:sensor domain-containing diguanylate cyclase [Sphingomonas sp. PP-CC-3G-468]|uniref:sensor domain-containing diguanylate cyclase n=1 Tax=Sphingomonas sp. PP-CC-3G-468 TaxID=2135656 RepID=UPI0010455565|nr:sensor domain-containing diguanylate cyclase [Sphingomonas sp. PP-CC-3G-468]TCM00516.1 PAS domain S-box-containing protein/diguanylate cyclase (GGDEF)-like protein [Sphingomonas sp. PP-CC-3G-468]